MYNNVNSKWLGNVKHQELLKYLLTSSVAMEQLLKHIMKIRFAFFFILLKKKIFMKASIRFPSNTPQKMLVFFNSA